MAADPVFIDTNVLVAAAVDVHPSHGVAAAYFARIGAEGGAAPRRRHQINALSGVAREDDLAA